MSRVILHAATLRVTTDVAGNAAVSLLVPGTFNGVVDISNGRFLSGIFVWSAVPAAGDRITGMRLEDTDGILAALGLSGNFPDYPVLRYFEDADITETADLKRGYGIPPAGFAVEKIDPREPYDFVPSGMYLKATVVTGSATLAGQVAYVNVIWGKSVAN